MIPEKGGYIRNGGLKEETGLKITENLVDIY